MIDPGLSAAFEATWPAAEYARFGGIVIGRGAGGGGRVSSGRAVSPDWTAGDLDAAVGQARAWRQPPMFRAPDDDERLIAALRDMGYVRTMPTFVMHIDAAKLTGTELPRLTAFAIWPPLAVQRDIWSAENISAGRQAVMDRVADPHCAILGRIEDRAAGAGFLAAHEGVAMLHALEIRPEYRRKGLAEWMVRFAAQWAVKNGASRLALAVSRGNAPAVALYRKMGFAEAGEYAYWQPAPQP
ncbi:GNAT family N-acetyltransferase [Paracoccus pacificus]|uniref:GNAT family N-acetyltransferase n=1 Tax=Paracoccus pacificus TaxID=1463598 RepID=A0ABW4R1N1_9RHOB